MQLQPSTDLAMASRKTLLLYRKICRMMPFILRVHDIVHATTPESASAYVGQKIRANASLTDLV
jgi:hypothetical protein